MPTASHQTRSRWLDLTGLRGAVLAVLTLRLVYGAALFFAARGDQGPSQTGLTEESRGFLWRVLVEPWLRRDAIYFHEIAASGYDPEMGTTAFHPLYPLLSRVASWLFFGNVGAGLLLVSTAATVALVVVFTRYVREIHGEDLAQLAGWSLLLIPGSIVWFLPYTDALFTLFAVASLGSLHRQNWWWAAAFAALATLTRQQGLVLALPMIGCLAQAVKAGQARWTSCLSVALIPAAYLAVAAYRVFAVGDVPEADAGMGEILRAILVAPSAAEISPGQRIAWPWEPAIDHVRIYLRDTDQIHMLLDLILGWGYAVALVVGLRSMTWPERLFSVGIVAVSLSYYNGVIAPYMALPRHLLIAFPLFILTARFLRDKDPRIYAVIGAGFNLVLVALFGISKWIP